LNSKSLFKDLARTGFHSSILTTYSVDAAFYDGSLHHRLRAYGCDNNILLTDGGMLQRAIAETPDSFTQAGRAYALVPVNLAGAFHPKVNLRLGSDSGCLIVGSANASAAGWGRNREVFGQFEWWRKRADGNEAIHHQLIRKAYDYVSGWLQDAGLESIRRKLDVIERDAAWLFDVEANEQPLALSDGSLVDLLCEDGKGGAGILSRLQELVGGAKVTRLVVLSPYWDAELQGLLELIEVFSPSQTTIALSAGKPEFPLDQLRRIPDVEFAAVFEGNDSGRFIHAKALIAQTEEWDHVVFGSANCSDDALGLRASPARNAECSVYRRVPAGAGLNLLGFDLASPLTRESLMPATRDLVEAKPEKSIPAGVIEACERNVRWQPSIRISSPPGAMLLIPEGEFAFQQSRASTYSLTLPAKPRFPLIARIRLTDGSVTSPVIVNDEVSLAHAAPGMGDKRLRAAFAKIELEGGDFLELASLAAIIFSDTQASKHRVTKAVKAIGRAADREKGEHDEKAAHDFSSPEDFRAAMLSGNASKGDSGRLNFDDPDAINLLRIIMRGIGQHETQGSDAELFAAEGEQESDGSNNNGGEPTEPARPPRTPIAPPRQPMPRDQANKQTVDIHRAISTFEKHLEKLVNETTSPPRKLTAEACFILRLMVEACRRPLQIKEGEMRDELFALDLVPKPHDRERAFPVRVGRILRTLWIGSRTEPALLSRISIGQHQTELPYDIFVMVASTRWALARSVMAMTGAKQELLGDLISKGALEVWRSTLAWPALDPDAELEFIGKMDAAMGVALAETEQLTAHYKKLREELSAA
jgi:hypothetical protein